jgi:hypothetical protein
MVSSRASFKVRYFKVQRYNIYLTNPNILVIIFKIFYLLIAFLLFITTNIQQINDISKIFYFFLNFFTLMNV